MADNEIASVSFGVDSSPVRTATDDLARLTTGINSATTALERMEARAATLASMSPAMRAMLGPSPAGGSAAVPMGGAMGAAGLSPVQMATLTASTNALTMALHGPVAPLSAFTSAATGAASALRALSQVQPPHAPAFAPTAPSAPAPAPNPGSVPRPSGGGAGGHGSGSSSGHGGSSYGNQLQMMELAHVGRALFDEAAAGGNVLRGLMMEAGRLQIAFSAGEGGIAGLLGRVGGAATALANPLALASAGILGFGAAAAYGFSRYEAGQEALQVALNGRGRFSGLTMDGANRLAEASAAHGGLSLAESASLTAGALGAGLTRDATASVVDMSRDLGRVTGKGTDEAGKMLTAALADPMRGLADFDKILGGVDDRLKAQIDDAVRSGHLAQAQALELGYVNKAMHDAGESAFSFSRAMSGAGNWISDRLSGLGHGVASMLGYGGDEENLRRNREQLAQLSTFDPEGNAPAIATLKEEIARLEGAIGKSTADAARREAEGRAIELSGRAGDAVRTLLPEVMRQRSAADTVELLRQTLADPLVMQHLDPSISGAMVGRAYSQASVLESMNRPGLRERQDYDLGLSRIRDSGVEDTGLNAARRAELEILRSTGDVVKAATAAQRSYNLELASAQERADELARSSKQNFDLIGLSPFERAMKEVDNKYLGPRGLIENYKVDSTRALDDKDIHGDLSGGFKILTAAQDTAGTITAAGGHLVASVEGIATKLDAAAGRIGAPEAAGRSPFGTLDRGAFGAAPVPFFAAGAKAFDAAPANIQAQALAASAQTGVPASIIAAIGQRENSYRLTGGTNIMGPNGRPASTAWGFGQLTDGAARDVAGVLPGFSKYDPSTAVLGSAEYLRILQGRFGDMQTALDHYGTGPGYGADIMRRAGAGALAAAPTSAMPASLTVAARDAATAPLHYTGDRSATDAYHNEQAGVLKRFGSTDPDAFGTPLGDMTRRLKEQAAMADLQSAAFGKVDLASRAAVEGQKLWQSYVDSGAEKTIKLSDATGGLADAVRTAGMTAAEAAAKADAVARQQQGIIGTEDTLRGGASSILTSGFSSMAHGKGFGAGASSALSSFGESLVGKAVDSLVGGFLGGKGQAGGGLLGSLFGGASLPHFAGGTANAPGGPTIVGESGPEMVSLPKGAQVMTAGQTSGLMAAAGSRGHTFNLGGPTINVQGDVSEGNRAEIQRAVAAGQQQTMDHITRNFGQIQRDAGQAG